MTYLQLINGILTRMRESTIAASAITQNYPSLVGTFVNDAKAEVEGAWQWKALRHEMTFTTVAGQTDYECFSGGDATGSRYTNEESKLLYSADGLPLVFDTTNDAQLYEVPLETLESWRAAGVSSSNQKPYTFSVLRSADGLTLRIYPAPDGAYAMSARFFTPQEELSAHGDVLLAPTRPVRMLAYALALEERGSGQGSRAEAIRRNAYIALGDLITREAEDAELQLNPC